MIKERYMVSAVPVNPLKADERIEGYVIGHKHNYLNVINEEGEGYLVKVQPDTIEPLKVKPVKKYIDGHEFCPNCEAIIYHSSFECCQDCGMPLDRNNQ